MLGGEKMAKIYEMYEYTPEESAQKLLEFNMDFSDTMENYDEELQFITELFRDLQKSEKFEVLAHYLDLMFMNDIFKLN
jgi:hypothetical protein